MHLAFKMRLKLCSSSLSSDSSTLADVVMESNISFGMTQTMTSTDLFSARKRICS
jgi:hypothetical protein